MKARSNFKIEIKIKQKSRAEVVMKVTFSPCLGVWWCTAEPRQTRPRRVSGVGAVGQLDLCRLQPAVNSRSQSVHPKAHKLLDKDRGPGKKEPPAALLREGDQVAGSSAGSGGCEVEQLFVGRQGRRKGETWMLCFVLTL